ncbi:hypothetical protein [Dishui Lake phycodnavirus 4]|nr:hypothetical protein [Dishui Lake phycodnavirus 4]
MRTGFDLTENEGPDYISAAITIVQPVIENAVVLAAQYAKACGRDVMIENDMEYALKYCVMHTVGVGVGVAGSELFIDDDDDDEDDEDDEDDDFLVDPKDCPAFERYSGDDVMMNKVNEAVDKWENWTPQSPIELFLKNAIDNNE